MEEICHVCGKPLDEIYAVNCIACGGKIHFLLSDVQKDNCSSIVTQWNTCALAFVCNYCSDQQPIKDAEPCS